MKSQKIRLKHRIEYAVLKVLLTIVCCIPLTAMGHIISGILRVLFRTVWPLKKESIARMREVFGEELPEERIRLWARHSMWNMLMNFIELIHRDKFTPEYLVAHIDGLEEALQKVRKLVDKHGGAVLTLPHMGNWDLAGIACMSGKLPLMALARPQNNPLVQNWMSGNRSNFTIIDRTKPREFVKIAHHLKSGGVFAILPDVRHNKPGVSTTCFGKPNVQLGKGLGRFTRMANVPIVPITMERIDASHHRITTYDPIYPDPDADPTADAIRLTQTAWDIFEKKIREQPGQWFWFNRRWLLTPLYTQTR